MASLMFRNSVTYINSVDSIASEFSDFGGKILVTGATGLVGSCVVDTLLAANDSYNCNFSIYALARNEKNLIERFGTHNNLHFVVQDVVNPIDIIGLDYIIHAASNADPTSYALFPVETILTNVLGAKNVLDYCRNKKTKVLLTSSFEVYGKLEQDEYVEGQYGFIDLNLIRSCYPESKRVAEMLFKSYFDEYDVDCVIARLSSVYGPTLKENDSKAHAQFIRNGVSGEDIVLKSKGDQKRTYCYVIDAVSGILAVLFRGERGEIYNVANDKSVATIADVAQTIADYAGVKVVNSSPDRIESKGFSKPQNCILNTDKIRKLGWVGRYDLKSGINETMTILKESMNV